MASFGNNIANFNKDVCSNGTAICAHKEDQVNILMQLFVTYDDWCLYNGPFTGYVDIMENQYNDGKISLESKYLMDKEK